MSGRLHKWKFFPYSVKGTGLANVFLPDMKTHLVFDFLGSGSIPNNKLLIKKKKKNCDSYANTGL